MSNRNRTAGHGFEREVVQDFRNAGFSECVSSRSESKRLDDAKVDLAFTDPFQVQCKFTKLAPNFHTLLKEMPNNGKINVVFHKRAHKGVTVTMSREDFFRMVPQVREVMLMETFSHDPVRCLTKTVTCVEHGGKLYELGPEIKESETLKICE